MSAQLTPLDRQRIRMAAARLAQARKRAATTSAPCPPSGKHANWQARVLRILQDGPATRSELELAISAKLNGGHRRLLAEVVDALIAEGHVAERPELTPARGVRCEPVLALHLVRSAA
jgi:hypothetical protein